jgi:DNA-binding MarR family transcriptional regulator
MNKKTQSSLGLSTEIDKFQYIMDELNRRCHERFRAQCEFFGVSEAELRCLRNFENQRYMTSRDLAAALGVVKSRVTKIVDGLEKKGFLQRTPDPGDSRVILFSLTPLGKEKWDAARGHVQAVNAAILARLSESQRIEMLSALAMLKVSMDAVSPLGAEFSSGSE